MHGDRSLLFRQLFDADSSTYTYLLADLGAREAILIDPVLDHIDRDAAIVTELRLSLAYALDTHVHADHVTALDALRRRLRCKTVLSERAGSACADILVKEGDLLRFGRYELEVRETPGHTSGCVTYVLTDRSMAFTGDALLVRGCGRTDFQQGDARALWRSVHEKIFSLPDDAAIYPAHDYNGRGASSVGEEKAHNPRLGAGKTVDEFVAIMAKLDLAHPKKMDVAVPLNLRCGAAQPAAQTTPAVENDWAPIAMAPGGFPEVSAPWLGEHHGSVRVVDVRQPDEYRGELGHVPGAELVPLATLASHAASWDRDAPVVTVCRSGGRSGKAALELASLGLRRIASMAGGMRAWNEQGLPVELGPPHSTIGNRQG